MKQYAYTTTDSNGIIHAKKMFGPEVPGILTYCDVMGGVVEKLPWGRVNCHACRKAAGKMKVRVGAQGVPHKNGSNQRPHVYKRPQ